MENSGKYLDGQLLIAMPSISDPRFDRSVVYICAHSADGAMGIVINQNAENINFPDLLKQLEILPVDNKIEFPSRLTGVNVHLGGPVESARGFVLHSSDYFVEDNTLPIDSSISLTATVDIRSTFHGCSHSLLTRLHVFMVGMDIIDPATVGNYMSVKAPLVPQDLLQQEPVADTGDSVQPVIGRHDGLCIALGNTLLNAWK